MAVVRIYFDEDSLDQSVVRALRAGGLDILTALEGATISWLDSEQLAFAATAGRALFSANIRDFAPLHRTWMAAGRHHPGIIVRSRQTMPIGDQLRAFRALLDTLNAEDLQDRFEYLGDWLDR